MATLTLINKSNVINILNAVPAATITGNTFVLPTVSTLITVQTIFNGSVDSVSIAIEGSADGDTWNVLDTLTNVAGEEANITTALPFIRAHITAINPNTATTATVALIAKPYTLATINYNYGNQLPLYNAAGETVLKLDSNDNLQASRTVIDPAQIPVPFTSVAVLDPTGPPTGDNFTGGLFYAGITGAEDFILKPIGIEAFAESLGSGNNNAVYGLYTGAKNRGTGNLSDGLYGIYLSLGGCENIAGSITNTYGLYVTDIDNAGTIDNCFAIWVNDQGADANITNIYYSWFDSLGVRRVKEDSAYDSGNGQAIEALYNPRFTKYIPGALNYERIILGQWKANVAEIGVESGGTGTLRTLRLIGNALDIVPAATFESTVKAAGYISSDNSAGITQDVTTATLVGKTMTFKDGLLTAFA